MVAHYFQQLLHAVIFMHNNGFCHRDLKAENCVVDTASQRVKVLLALPTPDIQHTLFCLVTACADILHVSDPDASNMLSMLPTQDAECKVPVMPAGH